MQNLINHIEESLYFGEKEVSKLTIDIMDIKGLTSRKVKSFLNNLCGREDSSYLEIGTYQGATFCSAVYGNNINATAIDDWKDAELLPANFSLWTRQEVAKPRKNPKDVFYDNLQKCGDLSNYEIINKNYLDLDFRSLKNKSNIIFYDGDHTYADQYNIMSKLKHATKHCFILVIDDWNWEKRGILKGIQDFKYKCEYKKEIFTKGEDSQNFWNGLGIFILYNNL